MVFLVEHNTELPGRRLHKIQYVQRSLLKFTNDYFGKSGQVFKFFGIYLFKKFLKGLKILCYSFHLYIVYVLL